MAMLFISTHADLHTNARLVMGWLMFSVSGRKFDCIKCLDKAHEIPVHVEDVEGMLWHTHICSLNCDIVSFTSNKGECMEMKRYFLALGYPVYEYVLFLECQFLE